MADSPRASLKKPLHLHALRTGDILGFSGCNPTSATIRVCTGGLICCGGLSHVAIVTWWNRHNPERRLLLVESTSLSSQPCLIQKKLVCGVQAHHIRQTILAYEGQVWHYPLAEPLDWEETLRLYRFCRQRLGTSYDFHDAAMQRHTLLARWLMRLRGEDLGRVDCSEWCAACHKHLGILPTDNASQFSPNRLVRTERRLGILKKPRRLK